LNTCCFLFKNQVRVRFLAGTRWRGSVSRQITIRKCCVHYDEAEGRQLYFVATASPGYVSYMYCMYCLQIQGPPPVTIHARTINLIS
jgi:hypothetical protein